MRPKIVAHQMVQRPAGARGFDELIALRRLLRPVDYLLVFLNFWQIRAERKLSAATASMRHAALQIAGDRRLRVADVRRRRLRSGERGDPRRCHQDDALLLGWYLGDGHIVAARRGVCLLSIANDPKYPDLNEEIAATMRLVKPTASPWMRGGHAIRIEAGWRHWPCLFPQHGPGLKHRRKIELEPWQREIVAKYPEQLLRGLFHSDGCRFVNWASKPGIGDGTNYYVRYMFSNESEDIRNKLTDALDLLGIPWRQPRRNAIAVSRREAVAALDTFVGPKS
jgi:hypothetical protein